MSPDCLRDYSRKQLELIARRQGVPNIRQLRKQDLIDVLATSPERPPSTKRTPGATPPLNARPRKTPVNRPSRGETPSSSPSTAALPVADEIDLELMDSQWLRATWRISQPTRDRAIAALGMHWHRSSLVLQLIDVTPEDHPVPLGKSAEYVLPAGTGVWYLHLPAADRTFRISLGYRSPAGKFHLLLRSRPVSPARMRPHMAPSDVSTNEPIGTHNPGTAGNKSVATVPQRPSDRSGGVTALETAPWRSPLATDFDGPPPLTVDVELIVRGLTHQAAIVTLQSRPLTVAADGSFAERMPLEAGRQVIPIVATAPDGSGERTVVVALDLSNRELEPRTYDDL